jgi:hypothetical protein
VLIALEGLLIQAAYAPFSPPVRGVEAERRDVAHGAGPKSFVLGAEILRRVYRPYLSASFMKASISAG